MQDIRRIHVGKAPIDVIGAEDAAHWVLCRLNNGIKTRVAAANSAIIVATESQTAFAETLKSFDLVLADGFWPALSASLLHQFHVPHTNTSPFLRALFRQSGNDGLKVFLLGARPEMVKNAAANLYLFHPNAKTVGYYNGYFDIEDEPGVVELINKSGATVLLVGISSPKKELFIIRNWDNLNLLLSIGVGGQFDIWGGGTREAPDWVRRYGFEWLFRLMQEPQRLLKRYSVENMRFLFIVLKQLLNKVINFVK